MRYELHALCTRLRLNRKSGEKGSGNIIVIRPEKWCWEFTEIGYGGYDDSGDTKAARRQAKKKEARRARKVRQSKQPGKTNKVEVKKKSRKKVGNAVDRDLVKKLKATVEIESIAEKLKSVRKNWMQYKSCFSVDDAHVHERLFMEFLGRTNLP